jgi:hypothetical protein
MIKLIKIVIAVVGFCYVTKFCVSKTRSFTINGISSNLAYNPKWQSKDLSEEEKNHLQSILKQKFTFYNLGGQSFVFLSQDGNYVLKFFKLYHRRLPFWMRLIPKTYVKDKQKKKDLKLERDFTGYTLAFNEMKEETRLVFVHLNKSEDLKLKVVIVDPIGIEHTLDMDNMEFVIQKRLTLAYEKIDELMKEGQTDKAKNAIHELIQIILTRYQKGIFDDDAAISRNFGFDGDKAILLDPGRFRKEAHFTQRDVYLTDLNKITEDFRLWLSHKHPELVSCLEEERACAAAL